MLIFDRGLKKLLLFDRNGKFIRQIGRIGRGPAEYVKIIDFATTMDHDTISIYDENIHAVLRYNKQGEFLNKVKIGSYFASMEIWKNKEFVMFTRRTVHFPKGTKISNFCVFNDKGKLLYEDIFYDHTELLQTKKVRYNDLYQLEDGAINVQEFFNDTIFLYNGEQLTPRFYFDFKEHALPEELKKSFLEKSQGDYRKFIKQVEDTRYLNNWSSIWFENDDFIATTRNMGFSQEYTIFIDKRNNHHQIFKRMVQNFAWGMLPEIVGITQNSKSNELVYVIAPHSLKLMKGKANKPFEEFKQQYPKQGLIFEEAISNIKLEDNPVLVFAKLKDYEKAE